MSDDRSIDRLVELVPPPRNVPSPAGDWEVFEGQNGFPPPPDYVALWETYGLGRVGWSRQGGNSWMIELYDAFDPEQSFVQQSEWTRANFRDFQREFPEQHAQWPIWPDAGGFLPWGATEDGDEFGWITVGPPERWWTACHGRQMPDLEIGSGGIVATLVGMLLGDVHPELDDLHDEMAAQGLRRTFHPLPRRARSAPGGEVRAAVFFGVVTGTEVPSWDYYAGHRSAAEFDAAYAEHQRRRDDAVAPWQALLDDAVADLRALGCEGRSFIDHDPPDGFAPGLHVRTGPRSVGAVHDRIRRLAADLGVPVVRVTDADRFPIWPELLG